jgi:hypothetical protein
MGDAACAYCDREVPDGSAIVLEAALLPVDGVAVRRRIVACSWACVGHIARCEQLVLGEDEGG